MVQSFPRGLEITAQRGNDLELKAYPYLAFYIQNRTKFTWVAIKGGVKPEWNQTIKFNQIYNGNIPGSTVLTISCVHKKTGVKLGHADGLIGKCEIDLKKTLFASENGVIDGWFQLMHEGKEAGRVQLKISLCEPSAEEDDTELKPARADPKKSQTTKKDEKKIFSTKSSAASLSTSNLPLFKTDEDIRSAILPQKISSSTPASLHNNDKDIEDQSGSILRHPSQLNRTRSMQDHKGRKQKIRFQEPNMRRIGSRSMEEVRDSATATTNSSFSEGDSFQTDGDSEEQRSVSSPKQTFTLQDSQGNINPLNVLIAPFDPNWLEPTPPILRRALSAHLFYDDLHTQMASNPRDLFPRPQSQQSYYPSESQYLSNGYHQGFQSFSQLHSGPLQPPQQPQEVVHQPQQQQQYHQQHQQGTFAPGITQPIRQGTNIPTPPLQNWPSQTNPAQPVVYQPHTVFQPRQSRSKAFDINGHSKHASLPARYQMPASQMLNLQNVDPTTAGQIMAQNQHNNNMNNNYKAEVVEMPALGPASGYLPDTYSLEHQRALSGQLGGQPMAGPCMPAHPTLGPDPRHNSNGGFRMPTAPSEIMDQPPRPVTRNTFYTQPPPPITAPTQGGMVIIAAGGSGPNQPVFFASPTPQENTFGQGIVHHSKQSSAASFSHGRSASIEVGDMSFSTMLKSPAIPIPAKIPIRARDAIFAQYTPRFVSWEGKDIHDSINDDIGQRILSRYALGIGRERNVREGFYIKDKSPLIADNLTVQQRQQQHRNRGRYQPQRQFTMEQEGNDRVILKYIRSKREWEIDSAMMRYLTCLNPEAKLESQNLEYPQPQQHNQIVNPFVVGLYETFFHPYGADFEYRYLSVMQWYPETLADYISDRTASGGGLALTLSVVRSLIECVEWIHSRKICHLNIKPTNFVRDPYASSSMSLLRGGGWKLIDFEAARVIDEEIVGRCTFSYAAPEVLEGNSTATAVRAKASLDIWSLGLVIYELLTDQPLFPTDEHAKERLLPNGVNSSSHQRNMHQVRYYDSKNISKEYRPLLDAMLIRAPEKRWKASQLLNMDLFKSPITPCPVPQDQLLRNNNIQTLRDLQETRLCNVIDSYMGHSSSDRSDIMNSSSGGDQYQLLEGIGRILDSPFDQVPRLFMILPPMAHDLDPTQPFMATNPFQNKGMRLVLLCEGLNGYGEDAHVTDHRGYVLHDPVSFVQDVGKLLLYLIAAAGTNNPGYETPGLDKPLISTGTPLDNCQRWYPSLRSYYEVLQAAIQRQLNSPTPSLSDLRSLRGPTLKSLESWLARLVRKQSQLNVSTASSRSSSSASSHAGGGGVRRNPSKIAPSDLNGHSGYDDLSDQLDGLGMSDSLPPELPEITGPGGGQGYGGLYKMPVGTCGDRWICRGCITKQMAMVAEAKAEARKRAGPQVSR
ncbi:hypothetical protein FBU30_008187 [Linnemannia zychae]|nr:hypothetical protein FBU30_008187 [Linnemannia zychae]